MTVFSGGTLLREAHVIQVSPEGSVCVCLIIKDLRGHTVWELLQSDG